MKFKIFDNYLPVEQFKVLQEELLSESFPWYLNKYQVDPTVDDSPQHVHILYDQCVPRSQLFSIVDPLLNKLNPATIRRIKVNLTLKQPEQTIGYSHVDYKNFAGKTAVFYINTNNGGTLIENELIQSVENRLIIFNSNILHSSVSCSDKPYRCVINLNFTEWANNKY